MWVLYVRRQFINIITEWLIKPNKNLLVHFLISYLRFIDEALAAEFMTVFRTLMERPELLGTGFLSAVRPDRLSAQLN